MMELYMLAVLSIVFFVTFFWCFVIYTSDSISNKKYFRKWSITTTTITIIMLVSGTMIFILIAGNIYMLYRDVVATVLMFTDYKGLIGYVILTVLMTVFTSYLLDKVKSTLIKFSRDAKTRDRIR
nr:MAG TPA: hypothetical protein [Caudoviricetes sp.]